MKQFFSVLRTCSLFEHIADSDLLPLLDCLGAKVRVFAEKQTILAEGTAARELGIVLSGRAQIVREDYCGNRSILSGIEPSELFGESFACAEVSSTPVAVVAATPCEVLLIDCRRILHSCSNACDFHRQMIFNLMRTLAVKNMMFHQKIEITSKRTTREKLLTYLTIQAKKHQSNRFDIPFDRQELADYLEVDRSGLSAQISKLCHEGVIRSERSHFELL